MKQQVVVIGLGRFGSSVANSLYNLGHDVLAMDVNEERVQGMMGHVTFPVTGNAANENVLRELGVPDYEVGVVAIGFRHRRQRPYDGQPQEHGRALRDSPRS